MLKYLKLLRIHHYIKNGLVFFPLVFSGRLGEIGLLCSVICGTVAFCLVASIVYILNDIRDAENDRQHSKKCRRPIASGIVSIPAACVTACFLFVAAVMFQSFANAVKPSVWFLLFGYLGLNLGYSFGLKNIPVIDIVILVSGFLIRVLYGSAVTGIEISNWLYLTVISLCFYLGLGKRRNELSSQANGSSRKVLQLYNREFLDKNMYVCLALTITFYALWTVDSLTIQKTGNSNLVWTVPLVIVICMKYSLNIEGNSDGDPVEVILADRWLLVLISILAAIMVLIIYL
ncbi:MAG: decaprenyl-phosphate phosphoribosyltransferase [Planctomycetaceae bacterium]|jgi:4-hydroxybenzoate polyprenyltransferase|nr:decaprenyl-phosphate phosphoribosyltransferase [Planctomycetaceae bacterium]